MSILSTNTKLTVGQNPPKKLIPGCHISLEWEHAPLDLSPGESEKYIPVNCTLM